MTFEIETLQLYFRVLISTLLFLVFSAITNIIFAYLQGVRVPQVENR